MNLESELLSGRIGKTKVEQIALYIQENPEAEEEIYRLTYHENDKISWQAWWVCETLVKKGAPWLIEKREEMVQRLGKCCHEGKKRLMLNILYRLPMIHPLPVDLLNFCLDRMLSAEEAPGVQAVCIKLAYEMCKNEPDLLAELYHYLDNAEDGYYSPATRQTRQSILKNINNLRKKKK